MFSRPAHRFACLAISLAAAGCSLTTPRFQRPGWSLTDADPAPISAPAKKYGEWNGPNAPKPLVYGDAPHAGSRSTVRTSQPMAVGAATTTVTDVVVSQGDTLTGLARRYGVSVDHLQRANGLSSDRIVTGQRLTLPRRY